MTDFAGRSVVVTGGTGGIGGAISLAFKAAGASVIAAGLGDEELIARRNDAAFAGIRIESLDVSDASAVAAFAATIDHCDHLVNYAGMLVRGGDAFADDVFTRTLEVNTMGTLRMSRSLLPQLEASGHGAVVNFASMLAIFGSATAPAYAASKGAVAQLTKSMAIAWAPKHVRVNAVAPGWIDTPMSTSAKGTPEMSARIVARTPLGDWGRPEHLAGPVMFLCSDAAAWVTGAVLPVDGGYSIA